MSWQKKIILILMTALLSLADCAWAALDYKTASIEQLKVEAQKGDVEAQSELQSRYFKSSPSEEDRKALFSWLQASAAKGDALAEIELGNLYVNGMGVERDPAKAFALFKQAADQGHPRAYGGVGAFYHYGIGGVVAQDYKEAFKWYRKAVDAGNHGLSLLRLGYLYRDGQGVEQNYRTALDYFKRSAGQDITEAYIAIGLLYENGAGDIAKDEKEAVKWYQGGVDRGGVAALYYLGNMYLFGKGVKQDYGSAKQLFEQAADKGYAGAYVNLGYLYDQGWGVPKDFKKSFELNMKAAEMGHMLGQYNVGISYLNGSGVPKDIGKAYEWFDKAAVQGDEHAIKQRDAIRANWKVGVTGIAYNPNPVKRGQEAKIVVSYEEPGSPDMPVPVTETWTLFMGDNAVMPSFTRTYTIKKEQTRHEFTLPIPAGAQTGIYKMKLHTASPVSSADSQLLLEIQ